MGVLLSVIGFLITIGIIILIHEGGHYWAAKHLGFAVERFSIGMGKVLWRFRRGETEFAVSMLPVGGYVMFKEDSPELDEKTRARLFETGARWKKAIVIAFGPLMNFILAIVLYAAVGAVGVEDIAPYVAPKPASQAEAAGVKPMDKVLSVDGDRIYGIGDLNLALMERTGEPNVEITFERRDAEDGRPYVYAAAFSLADLTLDEAAKKQGFIFPEIGLLLAGRGIAIRSVTEGGPADKAGLKAASLVLKVNGERATAANFSQAIRSSPGKPVELIVADGVGERTTILTPDAVKDEETGETVGLARLMYASSIEFTTVRHDPIDAVKLAYQKVVRLVSFQFGTLCGMAKGEVRAENLSGPVGIADQAGSAFAAGFAAFLEYIALISLAVGFMNLVPIPALDGGQLVLLGVESAARRDIPKSWREKINFVSIALIFLLAAYVTMNDVARLADR